MKKCVPVKLGKHGKSKWTCEPLDLRNRCANLTEDRCAFGECADDNNQCYEQSKGKGMCRKTCVHDDQPLESSSYRTHPSMMLFIGMAVYCVLNMSPNLQIPLLAVIASLIGYIMIQLNEHQHELLNLLRWSFHYSNWEEAWCQLFAHLPLMWQVSTNRL